MILFWMVLESCFTFTKFPQKIPKVHVTEKGMILSNYYSNALRNSLDSCRPLGLEKAMGMLVCQLDGSLDDFDRCLEFLDIAMHGRLEYMCICIYIYYEYEYEYEKHYVW